MLGKTNLLYVVFAVFFLFLAVYVYSFTPAIPISDQWDIVPVLQHADLQKLWDPVNMHRVFIPKSATLIIAYLTNWNLKYDNLFSLFLLSLIILLIFNALNRYFPSKDFKLLILLAVLVQFSPIHHESILWAGSAHLSCLLFFIIAMRYFNSMSSNFKNLIFAIFFLYLSSFSFFLGLIGWFIGLVNICFDAKKKVINVIIYMIAAVVCLIAYFYGLNIVPASATATSKNAIDMAVYFFAYLGANFIPTYRVGNYFPTIAALSLSWGLILLLISIYLLGRSFKKYSFEEIYMPFNLIVFSILAALLTAFGRTGYGLFSALLSRYHAVQMMMFFGVLWLFLLNYGEIVKKRNVVGLVYSIFIILILSNWISGIALGINKISKYAIIEKEIMNNCDKLSMKSSKLIFYDDKILKERIRFIKTKKYNVFSD